MFNPQTADGRLIILEYGSAEIARHPVFGIGLNEWVRPWYKKQSVDNFWLSHAMRFGLPSLAVARRGARDQLLADRHAVHAHASGGGTTGPAT